MKRIAMIVLGFLVSLAALRIPAQAQDQSSLGDYARQVRKSSGNPAKPKVFDNDNLPKDDKLSIVGPAAGTSTDNTAGTQADESANSAENKAAPQPNTKSPEGKPQPAANVPTETKAAESSAETKSSEANASTAAEDKSAKSPEDEEAAKQAAWKQWQDKLSAQKESIDLIGRELDVLQREYQIRAAAMYADAGNRLRNQSDWDKTDAQYKQQIADKQKALDDAKQKLDDMQEDARKAGVPANMRDQ